MSDKTPQPQDHKTSDASVIDIASVTSETEPTSKTPVDAQITSATVTPLFSKQESMAMNSQLLQGKSEELTLVDNIEDTVKFGDEDKNPASYIESLFLFLKSVDAANRLDQGIDSIIMLRNEILNKVNSLEKVAFKCEKLVKRILCKLNRTTYLSFTQKEVDDQFTRQMHNFMSCQLKQAHDVLVNENDAEEKTSFKTVEKQEMIESINQQFLIYFGFEDLLLNKDFDLDDSTKENFLSLVKVLVQNDLDDLLTLEGVPERYAYWNNILSSYNSDLEVLM
jgi:hypothetical protein